MHSSRLSRSPTSVLCCSACFGPHHSAQRSPLADLRRRRRALPLPAPPLHLPRLPSTHEYLYTPDARRPPLAGTMPTTISRYPLCTCTTTTRALRARGLFIATTPLFACPRTMTTTFSTSTRDSCCTRGADSPTRRAPSPSQHCAGLWPRGRHSPLPTLPFSPPLALYAF
ncbi:hypothetical protein K438DRAFT_1968527 [Mycena galopus ATCC 62051]|nr:hypothetical protein K438DRAFT_1968527 [Mycena galopus ATCC 62051]